MAHSNHGSGIYPPFDRTPTLPHACSDPSLRCTVVQNLLLYYTLVHHSFCLACSSEIIVRYHALYMFHESISRSSRYRPTRHVFSPAMCLHLSFVSIRLVEYCVLASPRLPENGREELQDDNVVLSAIHDNHSTMQCLHYSTVRYIQYYYNIQYCILHCTTVQLLFCFRGLSRAAAVEYSICFTHFSIVSPT